jgi:hypothetical protein
MIGIGLVFAVVAWALCRTAGDADREAGDDE